MRIATVIIGVGAAALVLSGCSKSGTTAEKTTVTETVTASSAPANPSAQTGSTAPAALANLPQPPSGATQLKSNDSDGVQHARYSITGQSPRQVADYYVGIWKGEGYDITDSSSGGEGGQYGGSGARASGSKAGTFVGVDAGAGAGDPTYFDICVGTDKEQVEHCGKHHD